MKHKVDSFIFFLAKTALFFTFLSLFFLGQHTYYGETLFYFWGNIIIILLYTAVLYLASRIYNGFNFGHANIQEIIVAWVLCLIIVNTFAYFICSLINSLRENESALLPVGGILYIFAAQVGVMIPMTILLNAMHYSQNPALSTIIIYGDTQNLQLYCNMISKQRRKFKVVKTISQKEQTGVILDAIQKVQAVFFLDAEETKQEGLIEYCYLNDKQVFIIPTFTRILYNTASTLWLANSPVFSLKRPTPDIGTLMIKRVMDIGISIFAIIISSPIMILIAILVRLTDNHPSIYKQERVTKGGRIFNIYKFRSMVPQAEDDGVPRLTAKNDARITPIGRFIRRTRIDELPQLFNVLVGHMSIVGPRPERPELVKMYEEIFPNFAFRTKVKAGMTGYAQIFGRYNTAPEDKLYLDIMYIERFSILQDMKLILQTLSVVFKAESTEGIDKDCVTALRNNGNEKKN